MSADANLQSWPVVSKLQDEKKEPYILTGLVLINEREMADGKYQSYACKHGNLQEKKKSDYSWIPLKDTQYATNW